jgi:hypothetical protein
LLEFLTAEKLRPILSYIVEEPETDMEYDRGYKLPYLASKMLSVENSALLDRFFGDRELLQHFFNFYRSDEAINPTLAGYNLKLFFRMFERNPTELLEFVFADTELVGSLVNHCYNFSVAMLVNQLLAIESSFVDI